MPSEKPCHPECTDSGPLTAKSTHDIDLDCGADTFEEAIIELAGLIAALSVVRIRRSHN
jgi:hypothetical protein